MKRKAATAQVLEMPIFGGLSAATRKQLARDLQIDQIGAGSCFLIEEDASEPELFIVVDGEVAITVEDRLLVLNESPTLIGLLSMVDEAPRTASATAFSDVTLARLSHGAFQSLMSRSPRFSRNVIEYLTREVRGLHNADERVRNHFDDHFDSPNARLVPGPYAMEDVDLRVFVMHGPMRAQAKLLPPGVRPLPGLEDRWLLVSGFYPRVYSLHPRQHAQPVAYAETAPLLPCLTPDNRPALLCIEAYPDNYMAIFLGRELYGFPRRFGLTRLSDHHLDLDVDSRLVLRASWEGGSPLDDAALETSLASALGDGAALSGAARDFVNALTGLQDTHWPVGKGPAMPILVRNQIPDVQQSDGDLLRVDELIELPVRVSRAGRLEQLSGAQVRRFAHDWMLGGRCVAGFRLKTTMTLGHAERLRSYQTARRRQLRLVP